MITDGFQRRIDYLRFSVTDLCNIRCHYCLPFNSCSPRSSSLRASPLTGILTFEEIARMVRILAGLGIRRVRLTGGEPLVRKNLPRLVALLCKIPDLEEVLLTTNALLLGRQAEALKEAGLKKINIHLDSLRPDRFRVITRLGSLQNALAGIEGAIKAGFSPIKLNMVLQRGLNDDEIPALIEFSAARGLILRLIELMPIGPGRDLFRERFISVAEIRERLSGRFTLIPSLIRPGSGPAIYYQVEELGTLVGFISPVSEPFCEGCNRIRIASDGRFQDCLATNGTFSFRDLLRNPSLTDDKIAERFLELLQGKREGHEGFTQLPSLRTPCMSAIGG